MQIVIQRDVDIILACHKSRLMAEKIGFSVEEQTLIVITVSEITSNIVKYTPRGLITINKIEKDEQVGMSIVATDEGPGISELSPALEEGYTTGGTLGLGLPAVRRLMDEFEIETEPNKGTTIMLKKWLKKGYEQSKRL